MAEINTFSSLIDEAVVVSGRPDRLASMASYLRSTIRESQSLALFAHDLVEDEITPTANPHIWQVPEVFRTLLAVKYVDTIDGFEDRYPQLIPPGRKQRGIDDLYYVSGASIVFSGVDPTVDTIKLAYYSYAKALIYYDPSSRPAIYDSETGWNTTDTAKQELVSNWLLMHWYDLLLEGTLAKVFKITGDQRAVSSFALYKSMQKDLLQQTAHQALGR